MTIQEKSLVATFGVLLALTLGYFGVQKMLLAKGREYDDTRIRLNNDLKAQERENRQAEGAARPLRGWTALTFDMDELRAGTRLGASLSALAERAGRQRSWRREAGSCTGVARPRQGQCDAGKRRTRFGAGQ